MSLEDPRLQSSLRETICLLASRLPNTRWLSIRTTRVARRPQPHGTLAGGARKLHSR
jgi:hypothetical protein